MGRIPELSELKPGITMCEFNVLISPEEIEEVTPGGIILAQQTKDMEQDAVTVGRIVSLPPFAGAHIWPEDGPGRPRVGDVVLYARYGGRLWTGTDGREYRAIKDKDILGIIDG